MIAQGYTWRSYQEDLPYPGFTGLNNLKYVRRHNPLIDFTDTCAPSQANNSVPFPQLASDIVNHSTPNYAYITPNLLNDAHDGPLSAADAWLAQNIPTILALPEFQPGGDGLMFIVFDEADLSSRAAPPDNRCSAKIANGCGGHLATLVIGPQVKAGYQSSVRYDHANLLRTICDAMGMTSCPGAALVEGPMSDFFDDVSIAVPFPNAAVASPVHIQATALNAAPVFTTQIYVDNALAYQASGSTVDAQLPMSMGGHYVVFQTWDMAGGIHKRGIYVNVKPQAVVVTSPAPNSVVGQSVLVTASGEGQNPIASMQLYLDSVLQSQSPGSVLNTPVSLGSGQHNLLVQATDSLGNLTANSFAVTSASPAIQILSPAPNASFYAPMQISATTIDPTPVIAIQVYVDNTLSYQVRGTGVQAAIPLSQGPHSVVVQAWNKSGATYKTGMNVNVIPVPITISSPSANSIVASPVTIAATVPASSPVQTMQLYVDNSLAYSVGGQSLSKTLALASGPHSILIKAWDATGINWSTGENITVQ